MAQSQIEENYEKIVLRQSPKESEIEWDLFLFIIKDQFRINLRLSLS